jgi:hypothetical protein
MKTKILFLCLGFIAFTLSFSGCGSTDKKSTTTEQTKTDTISTTKAAYACPMDPEVKSDKPGVCPKCGMDLEKVETAKKDTTKK